MLEATVWLKNETSIGPVGDMIGSLNIGGVGEDERLTLHSILAKDQISIWTRLRDACEEQIKRLTESAAKAEAAENPEDSDKRRLAHKVLADKIIDSGDLGDFSDLAPIPVPERIEEPVRTLKIPPPPGLPDEYPF